jgi:CII-binding regulator of phage lambda lysogenization HflD
VAKNYYDITLALAGICQAARLVQQLAHQGHCDSDALHVSLNSIIDLNPDSTLAVFGGSEANLRLGLETLLGVLNSSSRQGLNAELTRYTLSLMVLERKPAAKGRWIPSATASPACAVSWNISICSLKRCSAPWRASMLTSSARWARVFR